MNKLIYPLAGALMLGATLPVLAGLAALRPCSIA